MTKTQKRLSRFTFNFNLRPYRQAFQWLLRCNDAYTGTPFNAATAICWHGTHAGGGSFGGGDGSDGCTAGSGGGGTDDSGGGGGGGTDSGGGGGRLRPWAQGGKALPLTLSSLSSLTP